MHNTFLLSYDPLMTDPAPIRLVEFVRSNAFTYQYFVPFLGSILIKSQASVEDIHASYSTFIRPSSFLLTQVFPVMITGMLSQAQWDWINADTPPPLPDRS
jgi:hypothetical protein